VDAAGLLRQWEDDLASWAIPPEILAGAAGSPWVIPSQVFVNRARTERAAPSGPSFARAQEFLERPGSVLDVGAGAGAASLPLINRATEIIAVDENANLLATIGQEARTIVGRWPDVSDHVPAADVVLCHHVLYNVPDIGPFLVELTRHARRGVVVELTARHPLTPLNDLWWQLHGVRRPERPTAEDVIRIVGALGYEPQVERWERPARAEFDSEAELISHTAQRLCLPPERMGELATALNGRTQPRRELVTITWSAADAA